MLGYQYGACECEPAAEGEHQEQDWKADTDCRHGIGAKPTEPEGVDELVGGLEDIGEDDRESEAYQRAQDASFGEFIEGWGWGCALFGFGHLASGFFGRGQR